MTKTFYLAQHSLMLLCLQVVIGLAFGNWRLGGVLGAAYFTGREWAQAEYRWIERHGGGLRANMRWDSILRSPDIWPAESLWADLLVPIAVGVVVAFAGPHVAAGLPPLGEMLGVLPWP